MTYKISWKEGNKVFQSKKTWNRKSEAQKKVNFLRQLDDDLPRNARDKSLKTYRVIKTSKPKKIRKTRTRRKSYSYGMGMGFI